MAKRGIKVKDGEDLSPSNIERVISALEGDKPITKKEACNMLNISYNTTRLNRIIEEYKERKEYIKLRKKQVRNTPISDSEKKEIAESYLSNEPLSEISESTYRSVPVIKRVVKSLNLPERSSNTNYKNPAILEDDSWASDYNNGDLVFSARYDSAALIDKLAYTDDLGPVYRIWVLGGRNRYAYQPFYELADLRKLQKDLGVRILDYTSDEIRELIYEGLKNSKMKSKE